MGMDEEEREYGGNGQGEGGRRRGNMEGVGKGRGGGGEGDREGVGKGREGGGVGIWREWARGGTEEERGIGK